MDIHATVTELERLVFSGMYAETDALLARLEGLQVSSQDGAALGNLYLLVGMHYSNSNRLQQGLEAFHKATELIPDNPTLLHQLGLATARGGNHRAYAESRDLLERLLELYPGFLEHNPPDVLERALRTLAQCCACVGPKERSVIHYQRLLQVAPKPQYYQAMAEELATLDRLPEAEEALRQAIALDKRYASRENVQTLAILDSERGRKRSVQRHRYPSTEVFRGDLKQLIVDQIANEYKGTPRFLSRTSRIFTMGSCFAAYIARALLTQGYRAEFMPLSENINTSFANRYFVDWLRGELDGTRQDVAERIAEWMPAGASRQSIISQMQASDVFILTLGVAPAFFDRTTGEFVLPRPSYLNSRALAEKYQFRTTTVEDNVANVKHVLTYLRSIAPHARIFITVSPVPLHITFELSSAVVADCLSKSIMRVVAHEIVHNQGLDNIYYWPSFEVFRWAGSQLGPFYAADDGAAWHVSEAAVNSTVQSFIDLFGEAGPAVSEP
jgi:tetratricopeptide (TPR) repeat protein